MGQLVLMRAHENRSSCERLLVHVHTSKTSS